MGVIPLIEIGDAGVARLAEKDARKITREPPGSAAAGRSVKRLRSYTTGKLPLPDMRRLRPRTGRGTDLMDVY